MSVMNCPRCDADISESYEPDDWSCGISEGWYCDACDFSVAGWERPRPVFADDVPIMTAKEARGDRPLGTPISQLSSQPGDPGNPSDPRHAGYAEFQRIARSWGYE